MKVQRPLSGTYTVYVCDLCQRELSYTLYFPSKCHACERELCKECANWKIYSDGLCDNDDARWVAYCGECDDRLSVDTFHKGYLLRGLYHTMKLLIKEHDDALEDFDKRIRNLRSRIHETAESESKSLGKYGI